MKNFRVKIENTALAYECAADDTLLRGALRSGLGMSYECNVGSCGSCKFTLVEGEVQTIWADAPGLGKRDLERGRRLACQSVPLSDCTIKAMLGEGYVSSPSPTRLEAELREIVRVTHDMCEFRFRCGAPAVFKPGQYALLGLKDSAGGEVQRAYSMCNVGNREGDWNFIIRHVPNGAMTSRLFHALHLGDRIEIDGPYGLAYLRPESTRDLVCIAGGAGLSPTISIARGMVREPALAARRMLFFFGGRGPRDICGEDLLRELPYFGDRIHYHAAISDPSAEGAAAWQGARAWVHELMLETLGTGLADHEYYMAGPPPMIEAVLKCLIVDQKVPAAQIHYDRFF
ncbi:MAG: 2Fe-2S iron-sulfur cluster binding domain-containing protein [Candidatus Binataceae bacterium]|nr:2Fe-2S iron-sulfur cluster binding domain-containing protein [Candidatus Binataceae bacterium]